MRESDNEILGFGGKLAVRTGRNAKRAISNVDTLAIVSARLAS
jgi:hypothetical protein